jgi:hypothetical protein
VGDAGGVPVHTPPYRTALYMDAFSLAAARELRRWDGRSYRTILTFVGGFGGLAAPPRRDATHIDESE